MKLDIACIRDILLYVETLPFDCVATVSQLCESCPMYSKEEITYNCLKLIEGGYLDGLIVPMPRSYLPGLKCIICMTFEGHQFLETIRPDTVFQKTKKALASAGTFSFDVVTKIGTTILTQLATSYLGL